MKIDLTEFKSEHSFRNRAGRAAWALVWFVLFRPTYRCAHAWRRVLLRVFGAGVGRGVRVYPSCRIWAPWNLTIGDFSCLGENVDCYSVDKIRIGANAIVSQYSYLCTATHDICDSRMGLVTQPIDIGDGAWICADVFVGPGVSVGEGAVASARAVVIRDVPPWTVVAGNPAKESGKRVINEERKMTVCAGKEI